MSGLETHRLYRQWRLQNTSPLIKGEQNSYRYSHTQKFYKDVQWLNNGNNFSDVEPQMSNFILHWTADKRKQKVKLAVAVEARGWVALGFSEMGGMKGADIVIFETRNAKLIDAYSLAYEHPKTDYQQDWFLLNSTIENGLIIFEAERDLDTKDTFDRPLTEYQTDTHVIGAWGDLDEIHYHGSYNRVKGTVSFFRDHDDEKNNENGKSGGRTTMQEGTISIHMDQFVVPHQKQTAYFSKCVAVSELVESQHLPNDKPLHLIGIEVKLDPGHLVHHIALYQSTNGGTKCNDRPTSAIYIWNKGQRKKYYLPPDVGMLLADESPRAGSGLGAPPKAFRLEIHYENAERIEHTIDSSGLQLRYTSNLKKFTAGTLEVADPQAKLGLAGIAIGDGLRQHDFSCPSSCTEKHLSPLGVTVFISLLHMHQKGLTMEIVHSRDGKEIGVTRVEYFDFAFGGYVDERMYKVLPGDHFLARCTYNGDPMLKFGVSAKNEMCMGTMFYYPASLSAHLMCTIKSDVKECVAHHSTKKVVGIGLLNRTFGVVAMSQNSSFAHKNMTTRTEIAVNSILTARGALGAVAVIALVALCRILPGRVY